MAQIIQTTFQFKRGDAERWNELNPILAEGEPGFELDTNKFKIGNGINTWEELPYKGEANIVNAQTRNNFPAQGNENVIYKAQDEKLLYQWNPNISEYEVLGTVEEPGSGNLITVDTELSASSMNPVANKVITMALQDRYTKQEVDTAIENTNKRINLLEGTTHFKGVYPNLNDETLNDNLYEFSAGDIFIVGNAEYICTTSGDLALLEKANYEKLGDVTAEVERISALEEKVGNEGNGEIEATGLYQAIANLENNKLDKTDIINTLDSTALDKPLSAAMGKELNSLIKELSTDVNGIKSIAKTSTSGLVDTYTITFTNNTTTTFTVTNGDDGTSVSISSITESTESGGENVVEFSDGKTLTVKNGNDGDPYTLTESDRNSIVQSVLEALGGQPVAGYFDENNNIVLTSALADGTYTLKLEKTDGTYTLGTVTVKTTVNKYTVTFVADGVTVKVVEYEEGATSLDPNDVPAVPAKDGYTGAWKPYDLSNGGNIIVNAIYTAVETAPTNFANPSDSYWQRGYRLATGYGYGKACDGHLLTNFIPAKKGDVIYVTGLNLYGYVNSQHAFVGAFTGNSVSEADTTNYTKRYVAVSIAGSGSSEGAKHSVTSMTNDDGTTTYSYTILMKDGTDNTPNYMNTALDTTAYIRVSAPTIDGVADSDIVINVKRDGVWL